MLTAQRGQVAQHEILGAALVHGDVEYAFADRVRHLVACSRGGKSDTTINSELCRYVPGTKFRRKCKRKPSVSRQTRNVIVVGDLYIRMLSKWPSPQSEKSMRSCEKFVLGSPQQRPSVVTAAPTLHPARTERELALPARRDRCTWRHVRRTGALGGERSLGKLQREVRPICLSE